MYMYLAMQEDDSWITFFLLKSLQTCTLRLFYWQWMRYLQSISLYGTMGWTKNSALSSTGSPLTFEFKKSPEPTPWWQHYNKSSIHRLGTPEVPRGVAIKHLPAWRDVVNCATKDRRTTKSMTSPNYSHTTLLARKMAVTLAPPIIYVSRLL